MGQTLCKRNIFSVSSQVLAEIEHDFMNVSTMSLKYSSNTVEINRDIISYQGRDLFSDIGGTLGLTVGLSGKSTIDFILDFIRYLLNGFKRYKLKYSRPS